MDQSIKEAREVYHEILNDNNMCRQHNTPMDYKNQELITDLNEFMIALKVNLHPDEICKANRAALPNLQERYPKPTIADIDAMHQLINQVLIKDATPLIKY